MFVQARKAVHGGWVMSTKPQLMNYVLVFYCRDLNLVVFINVIGTVTLFTDIYCLSLVRVAQWER